jgi:regulator of sigma D
MIATSAVRALPKSALPALMKSATRTQASKPIALSLLNQSYYHSAREAATTPSIYVMTPFQSPRFFSTAPAPAEIKQDSVGTITNKVRVLDMDVVKTILDELRSVDANSDERLDADELKQLLRKHNSAFTEEEIMEIGELFYAGKSGGSIPFERFVEAIDTMVQAQDKESNVKNPLGVGTCGNEFLFVHNHHWTPEQLDIKITHTEPQNFRDRLAFRAVKGVRFLFDAATGWNGTITADKILNRAIYLETIAAVPGMVAAIIRHFKSLRAMKRDGGMMQMFLDEANNERMHLLSFVRMKNPGVFFRAAVIGGQLGFGSAFMLSYMASPKFCHRFVGYVEEEACSTYTKIISSIENAPEGTELAKWRTEPAPKIARSYWHLGENGTVLDMFYSVRADEAEHRDVNHLTAELKSDGDVVNPVFNTEQKLNTMLLKYVKDLMDRTPESGKPATV